ncbi:Hypothetical predicted protein [Olea europaea subsp. europaea]|uniref:Uncharacterized protein n=1 Tax=Olea europaea subsp. europaea TaxID=158383 RepID=A0A8S0QRW4_OLEEU|nr:Hypothetical predicted protein [Olea europaea subsp. europaea]
MEIRDLDSSDMEMAMPYMYEVQYIKPVQPERSRGEKRKGGMVDRSVHFVGATRKLSYLSEKASTPLLMIINGRFGHFNVPLDDGDDDFVDTPPRWQGTTFHVNSPSREDQLALNDVRDAEITVDSKGKGKMETVIDVEFPYSLQPPSFDLGVCFTQPTPIEPKKSKKVETYVESVEYDVLKDTKSTEKVESPVSTPSSRLPVKRAPRSAKALQSLYVHEG